MYKSTNNSIISKFISKEIEHIYNKYNSIPEEEINTIRKFIEKVEENSLDFDPYLNYATTKVVAEDVKDVVTINMLIDFQHILPEYVDLVTCDNVESYTSSLILLSSDYSISLIIPLSLTPKELLNHMEI